MCRPREAVRSPSLGWRNEQPSSGSVRETAGWRLVMNPSRRDRAVGRGERATWGRARELVSACRCLHPACWGRGEVLSWNLSSIVPLRKRIRRARKSSSWSGSCGLVGAATGGWFAGAGESVRKKPPASQMQVRWHGLSTPPLLPNIPGGSKLGSGRIVTLLSG